MVSGIRTFVSNIFSGISRAYIYIWLSKSHGFVYVGQTNERYGTWGRGYSHIQSSGTLRTRCEDSIGVYLDTVEDLILFSYPLPESPEFTNTESSFRLAVEYLVQIKLHEIRNSVTHRFRIVSNVTSTDRTNNKLVRDLATHIVTDFIKNYNE